MSSNRIDKVNSLLECEISKIIQREVMFPNGVLVTLTHVEATANLIEAKVYISVYFTSPKSADEGGPEEIERKVLKILTDNIFDIQQKINKKLYMRPIPKIIFVIDKKKAEADRIEKVLEQLKKQEK